MWVGMTCVFSTFDIFGAESMPFESRTQKASGRLTQEHNKGERCYRLLEIDWQHKVLTPPRSTHADDISAR